MTEIKPRAIGFGHDVSMLYPYWVEFGWPYFFGADHIEKHIGTDYIAALSICFFKNEEDAMTIYMLYSS